MKNLHGAFLAACLAILPLALPRQSHAAETGSKAGAVTELDSLYEVNTTDGQALSGTLLEESDSSVTIRLQSGGKVTLDRKSIASIKMQKSMYKSGTGELWHRDANRTRYLYSPSAMMLKQGECSFSQKELMFSSFGIGVTDNLNVQVASMVPLWFMSHGNGFNLILGAKAGGQVIDKLSLAGGIQTFIFPEASGSLNLPFASVTVGDETAHLTVTYSSPFIMHNGPSGFGKLTWLALCGNLRTSKRTALVTENWIFKLDEDEGGGTQTVWSLAMRIFGEKISVDVGAFFQKEMDIPLPWLDFTYNFGL
jgi:hypothetical protein